MLSQALLNMYPKKEVHSSLMKATGLTDSTIPIPAYCWRNKLTQAESQEKFSQKEKESLSEKGTM